eukprot:Plantae.Rhodophyta-Purpureofilum_apyrenoidigerum.ctg23911.p1 GENE.Plantae.Rhodophyta-Purpureofilum_apyrenoidigerum.ctg23911~~Plantae.Rhodophyta-Purpureofilum_apyrenoidigerum.ctg23911.p1  ORF type:complete len:364 (-),score=55.04 Plantae.Rhodophyta-Purpureofilum_apyrenoidigerum.ctg23911:190-1281(-)
MRVKDALTRSVATLLKPTWESRVGAAALPWNELGFKYVATNGSVRATYEDGRWSETAFDEEPTINMHMAATALHYGQTCFEGLKAFASADGGVKIFRPDANAGRMRMSAERLMMPTVPEALFIDACRLATKSNVEFVPPHGTDGALYLRPLLLGTSPRIGVSPSTEALFLVIASPVGDYYKGAFKPVTAKIVHDYDRAAPRGLGNVKTAANYAADMLPSTINKKLGFDISLYLDSKENKYIEEFGTSNFAMIKGDTFITAKSNSILASITNDSVQQIVPSLGLKVERRAIHMDELNEADEVAAIGTAVVLTPVTRFQYKDHVIQIGKNPERPGPIFTEIYRRMRAIQTGDFPDEHQWMVDVCS